MKRAGNQADSWGLSDAGLALGISLGGAGNHVEWRRALRWVERAENLGLHSVWVPEMHFAPGVSASPLLALSAFAANSERIRLGTTSLLLPIHDPLRIAQEVAALDRLSGGRVLLGLGRGFRPQLFKAFGIDSATKRDLFDAALDQMLEAWNGSVPPVQKPHPPLAVAAFGPKGLAQAARRALPYLVSPMEPLDLIAENLNRHADALPETADSRDIVVPIMRTVHVAANDAEALRVSAAMEREIRSSGGRVPKALARAAEGGVAARTLIGTTHAVIDQVGRYRDRLGMDLLIARPQVPGASDAEREASLERLAGEVLGAL